MTKDEYDRYDAVLAFLKGALATGPTSVAELEVQARAAMFLGERQSITHSKPFKRAKRTLGIRSVRAGFGVAGEWFWTLPPPLRSEKHGPARTTSSEASPAIIDGAGQIACGPIGVPLEWIYGVANLDRGRAPAHVPLHRWRLLIDDCERFLDPNAIWAARAAGLGWTAEALFGCARTQPLAYLQVAGLLWVLGGRRLIRLHRDWASIEDPVDGSHHVMNRRHTYEPQIVLPWRL